MSSSYQTVHFVRRGDKLTKAHAAGSMSFAGCLRCFFTQRYLPLDARARCA